MAGPATKKQKTITSSEADRVHQIRKRDLGIPGYPRWGSFSLDNFPAISPDKPGIDEFKSFMHQLDRRARWAITSDQIAAQFMTDFHARGRHKPDIIQTTPRVVSVSSVPADIILIRDRHDLDQRLRERFEKPLFFRAELADKPLVDRQVSIDDFWARWLKNPQQRVDVYDCTKGDVAQRTAKWSLQEIRDHWKLTRAERHAINVLDLENRFQPFCPQEIADHDLLSQANNAKAIVAGKTGSTWTPPRGEFLLLSQASAVSPIHVDNAAQLTWVLVLEGRKIWYFPRTVTRDSVRYLGRYGAQVTEGYGGWAKVEICAGDMLIMPPSWPHAVFTADDCLAVGGFFYTAPHLNTTLKGLRLQEEFPGICNEDLAPPFYEALAEVIDHLPPLDTPEIRASISSAAYDYLRTLDSATLARCFDDPSSEPELDEGSSDATLPAPRPRRRIRATSALRPPKKTWAIVDWFKPFFQRHVALMGPEHCEHMAANEWSRTRMAQALARVDNRNAAVIEAGENGD